MDIFWKIHVLMIYDMSKYTPECRQLLTSLGEACPQTPINKHAQQKQQSGYIPFSILSKLFPPCLNLNLLQ